MKVRPLLFTIIGCALLAVGITTWLARHSFVRDSDGNARVWTLKALEDDTLLLQQWLGVRGWQTRREGGSLRTQDLPPKGLLILLRLGAPLTTRDVDALETWIQQGGHLVLDATAAPFRDARGTSALLDRYAITLAPRPPLHQEQDQDANQITTSFEGYPPMEVRYSPAWRLHVTEGAWDRWIGDKRGCHLVQRQEGLGMITVATDLSMLYNHAFTELDHAAWFSRCLRPPDPGAMALLWSRPVEESFVRWAWARAWPFFTSLGVLLLMWLWGGLWRFGARLPASEPTRRSLLEHLEASGRFLWRQGGREALVHTSRMEVLRLAARRHPAFSMLPEDDRWAFLEARTALGASDIAEALDDRPGADPSTLSKRLQILQLLRQRLS